MVKKVSDEKGRVSRFKFVPTYNEHEEYFNFQTH